jgi:hypothetical protein
MVTLFDVLDIENIDVASIAEPFYIWPLSKSSLRLAKSTGLLDSRFLKGFIDNCEHNYQIGAQTYTAILPNKAIDEKIFILSFAYRDDILEDLISKTSCRECYIFEQGQYLKHVRDLGDCYQMSRPAIYDNRRKVLLELFSTANWPEISNSFRRLLRNGLLELTEMQIESLLHFRATKHFDVIYFSIPAYFTFVRQSIYARKKGLKTLLITLQPEYVQGKEKYFDDVIQTDGNHFLAMAYALLSQSGILHIRGWMKHYMTVAILSLLSHQKTVVEFMDIPEFFSKRKEYTNLYGPDIADDDFSSFATIFKKANGLLFNHNEKAIEKIKKKYNLKNNIMKFHNYVCDEFCYQKDIKLSTPYLIAYAGTVVPSFFPSSYFGDCQLLPLIKLLTLRGIKVTIFGNPHVKLELHYWDYAFEANRNSLFNMNAGGFPEIITERLAQHHFGLLMYIYDEVIAGRYHLMNLPTKFTLYLEAGLPLLVSKELEYTANMVEENGIGIVVDREGINKIDTLIAECDYDALRQNVIEFRKHFNTKIMIGTLLEFYGKL